MTYRVEKAKINDAAQIHRLINHFADKGEMLARPLSEIYENIRDYFVVRQNEQVMACAALHINWEDLAEIKSLVVSEESQKHGLGDKLIAACLKEAERLGIATVFCLTYRPAFFEKCGFSLVDRSELPHKVWGECYRCPQFPNCDEVALVCHLEVKV
ncbi:MAG: GNAT family N-acetyltransferase [Dehalococcoidales bacterium]|jgi:amino-acid N-acetyltransferase|nr:GNAT family N-acetyltransferase [Dehalococcoidales bacterium]|tara:strand:- start:726 stop:1196 length:471 start_codon:yes stop_codon:yes gene_type:complete